jgi:hypothetical protein
MQGEGVESCQLQAWVTDLRLVATHFVAAHRGPEAADGGGVAPLGDLPSAPAGVAVANADSSELMSIPFTQVAECLLLPDTTQ